MRASAFEGCGRRWRLVVLLVAGLIGIAAVSGVAGDNPFLPSGADDVGWPSVRGPKHDAHSDEISIAEQWPQEGPPVLWVKEIGQGYSAFVARGRRVFTQAQSLAGQFVICLDADTGKTIWEHRYGLPYESVGVYPGPRATPTLAADKLVFAAPDGMVRCLKADSGAPVWTVNVSDRYHGKGYEFGYSCSPTIVGEQVLLAVGGQGASLVSLHLDGGRELWKSGDDPASYAPLLPIRHAGRDCVVGLLQNALVICDLHSGQQLARMKLSDHYDEHSAWPLYREPFLWYASPFRSGSVLVEIPPLKPDTPLVTLQPKLTSPKFSNDVLSSVLVDGHVYGFDIIDVQSKTQRPSRGYFRCQEFETGAIKWSVGSERAKRDRFEDPSNDPYVGQAGIVVADGKLLMLNELGELILARVNPERYEELARVTMLGGELVWTPPILHRGRLYVRNQSRAVCLLVGDPQRLESAPAVTLRVADVPQSNYIDWAGAILSIEPEYAFDVPADDVLWHWFEICMALLVGSQIGGWLLSRSVRADRRAAWRENSARTFAFVAGCLGTTLLSHWTGKFIFTWPLSLFVAFEIVVNHSRRRSEQATRLQRLQELSALLGLSLFSILFFVLCRRLSLVFEWVFLVGPLAALPFSAMTARWQKRHGPLVPLMGFGWRLLAFTAFFAISIAVLKWKYPTASGVSTHAMSECAECPIG